ncbi:hypothetical protein Tco_0247261 [Tanacetum coccineum]
MAKNYYIPSFHQKHSQITKVDPLVSLFVSHKRSLFESDFVSLDPRLKSKKSVMDSSFTLGSTEEVDNVKIFSAGMIIAFDPTKSPHYKLVDVGRTFCNINIQIYSSETGKWSLCSDRFNYFSFDHFDSAIYWNDGLHWLETENSIVLGEMEQDLFLVIKLSGKVVQYNLISKTLHEIYDCGSNQVDDNHDDNDDAANDDDELL